MKQRTIITDRKHVSILLIAVMILMAVSLTGCSKKPTLVVEESKPSTESSTVAVEVKPSEEAEASSEPASEPSAATEPTTEAVVYEGIDMESDLPGEEWLKTFVGVVDEPVVVIYNDNTGRKEIIQEGSVVKIEPDGDKVATYLPEGMMTKDSSFPLKEAYAYEFCEIWIPDVEHLKGIGFECPARVNVGGGAEDWTLNFYILVE